MSRLGDARGYTLVELIMILGIVGLLSGLVIANTRTGNRNQEIRDAAERFTTLTRQAESMAAGSQVVDDPSDSAPATSRVAYGVCTSSSASVLCENNGSGVARHYQLYARKQVLTSSGTSNAPTYSQDWLLPTTGTALLIRAVALPAQAQTAPGRFVDYVPPSLRFLPMGQVTPSGPMIFMTIVPSSGPSYPITLMADSRQGAIYVQ